MSAKPAKFENVSSAGVDSGECLERIRVPGGWLYRNTVHVYTESEGDAVATALCFVPNPPKKGKAAP